MEDLEEEKDGKHGGGPKKARKKKDVDPEAQTVVSTSAEAAGGSSSQRRNEPKEREIKSSSNTSDGNLEHWGRFHSFSPLWREGAIKGMRTDFIAEERRSGHRGAAEAAELGLRLRNSGSLRKPPLRWGRSETLQTGVSILFGEGKIMPPSKNHQNLYGFPVETSSGEGKLERLVEVPVGETPELAAVSDCQHIISPMTHAQL